MRLDSFANRDVWYVKLNRGRFCPAALFLLCVCLSTIPVHTSTAATFSELYTVSVLPDPEARDQRADAIGRGMSLLLTRITGRQQAAAYPEMRNLIDNAERYLVRYAPLPGGEIRVGFSQTQMNQELTRLNMPIWGEERPSTLLWVASDFGNGQRAELKAYDAATAGSVRIGGITEIRVGAVSGVPSNPLAAEDAEFFTGVVREILIAADERGLPLVLPELDAADREIVRFADVWGGFEQFVARAAERYAVDAIVIARVARTEFGPEVSWTVQRGDRRQTLTGPRVREGINWLADEFASEYTTVGDARITRITIREFRNWTDFRIVEYVRSISIVESAQVESVSDGELVLRVAARGDDSQLDRVLTLGGQLLPVQNSEGLVYMPSWVVSTGLVGAQ
jgi:hypothetical protein